MKLELSPTFLLAAYDSCSSTEQGGVRVAESVEEDGYFRPSDSCGIVLYG